MVWIIWYVSCHPHHLFHIVNPYHTIHIMIIQAFLSVNTFPRSFIYSIAKTGSLLAFFHTRHVFLGPEEASTMLLHWLRHACCHRRRREPLRQALSGFDESGLDEKKTCDAQSHKIVYVWAILSATSCILDRRSVHSRGWGIGSLHVRPLPAFVDPQLLDLPGRLLGTRDCRPWVWLCRSQFVKGFPTPAWACRDALSGASQPARFSVVRVMYP